MTLPLWKYITNEGDFLDDKSFEVVKNYICNHNSDLEFELIPEGFSIEQSSAWKTITAIYQTSGYRHDQVTIKTSDLSANYDCKVITQPTFVHWAKRYLEKNHFEFTSYTPVTFMHFIGRLQWDRAYMHCWVKRNFEHISYYRMHGYKSAPGQIGKCIKDMFDQGFGHNECLAVLSACEYIPSQNTGNFEKLDSNYSFPDNVAPLKEYYQNAFLDIVHETDVSKNNFFITEKTLRPIIFHRPFILSGGANFLANLRNLGFKTFSSWWSEDYDMYHGKKRLKEMVTCLQKLKNLSIQDKRTILKEMKPVLEHNYQRLKNFI